MHFKFFYSRGRLDDNATVPISYTVTISRQTRIVYYSILQAYVFTVHTTFHRHIHDVYLFGSGKYSAVEYQVKLMTLFTLE